MRSPRPMEAIRVEQPGEPIPAEIIASAIVKISEATTAMLRAGLKYETIVTLVHDNSKVAKRDIRLVLNNLSELKENFCSKK